MNDNTNEVAIVEQDLLMTVEDFAKQEGVTPRTVYRWIEIGRIDTVERLGKKYVNASVAPKAAINDSDNDRHDTKSKNVGALQNVNIFEEYLKTIRETSKRFEKSCRRWQIACFASAFILIVVLIAGTAIGLAYHYGTENLSNQLEVSSVVLKETESKLGEVESDKIEAISKFDEQLELKLEPYKQQNETLSETIRNLTSQVDKLTGQNDNLRDQLSKSLDKTAILLQQQYEKAAIDEVASVKSLDTP